MKTSKSFFVLFSFLIVCISKAQAFEVLRDADDGVRLLVDHYTATGVNRMTGLKEKPDICEQFGKGRLPTIRELAELSKERGAEGILEVADRLKYDRVPEGYHKISGINSDGQIDEFYFYHLGYQPDDSLRSSFWVSALKSLTFTHKS